MHQLITGAGTRPQNTNAVTARLNTDIHVPTVYITWQKRIQINALFA